MTIVTMKPAPEAIRTHGVLAYVDDAERKRIYALPAGKFQQAIRALENAVEVTRKRAAKRQGGVTL